VWSPEVWREQSEDKKQGSGDKVVTSLGEDQWCEPIRPQTVYADAVRAAIRAYNMLIDGGVCREQARAVLPTGVYTEWVWTGTLQAWAHLVRLRTAPNAQAETREFAEQIRTELVRLWPVAMAALGATE
jgi:thymidylate synthase (FAD)